MPNDSMLGTVLAVSAQFAVVVAAIRWSVWMTSPPRQRVRSHRGSETSAVGNDVAAAASTQAGDGEDVVASPERSVIVGSPQSSRPPSSQTDAHLMGLIRRIQCNPHSHIFWKELRAYLISQREEERRHGLLLQSELPIVCFGEEPELVATQIEVRSLVAREHIRRHRSSARSTPRAGVPAGESQIQLGVTAAAASAAAAALFSDATPLSSAARGDVNALSSPRIESRSDQIPPDSTDAAAQLLDFSSEDDFEMDDHDDGNCDGNVEKLYEEFCKKIEAHKSKASDALRIKKNRDLDHLRVVDTDDEEHVSRRAGETVTFEEGQDHEDEVADDSSSAVAAGDEADAFWFALSMEEAIKTSRSRMFRAEPETPTPPAVAALDHLEDNEVTVHSTPVEQQPAESNAPSSTTLNVTPATAAGQSYYNNAMATFFFKQLQELKQHASYLRLVFDLDHRPFLQEFQHFEDQLRRMATHENPHLFRTSQERRAPPGGNAVGYGDASSFLRNRSSTNTSGTSTPQRVAGFAGSRPQLHSSVHSRAAAAAKKPPSQPFNDSGPSPSRGVSVATTSSSSTYVSNGVPAASLHAAHVANALRKKSYPSHTRQEHAALQFTNIHSTTTTNSDAAAKQRKTQHDAVDSSSNIPPSNASRREHHQPQERGVNGGSVHFSRTQSYDTSLVPGSAAHHNKRSGGNSGKVAFGRHGSTASSSSSAVCH